MPEDFAMEVVMRMLRMESVQKDILDKIVLANSFLDTFEKIIFVGEVAMACLHALGISPGKVERPDATTDDYEAIKEFVLKLFARSVAKQVEIVLPVDYVTAEMGDIEEIKEAAAAKAAEEKAAAEAKEAARAEAEAERAQQDAQDSMDAGE